MNYNHYLLQYPQQLSFIEIWYGLPKVQSRQGNSTETNKMPAMYKGKSGLIQGQN